MANARIKQLEDMVAHYEDIMRKCPRCKAALPVPEMTPAPQPSDRPRVAKSPERPAAEAPPLLTTQPREQPLPANTKSPSIRSSKRRTAPPESSAQNSNEQQYTSTLSGGRPRPVAPARRAPPLPNLPSTSSLPQPNLDAPTPIAMESLRQSISQSQTRPPIPPSEDLPLVRPREKHSGALIDLDLQGFYKTSKHDKSGRGGPTRSREWVRSAELMIEDVPPGRHWRNKLSKTDSSILAAVVVDNALVTEGDVSLHNAEGKSEQLVRLVRGFARRHSEGRIIFEQFILVCMCNVLSAQGVPQDELVQTLQICISDTSKSNVMRYLKGSIWVNELMNDLFFTEWGYRAVDLIVLWNRPISTYGKIASAPDSYQYFISHLTQTGYYDGYHELSNRRHNTIPWIVKKELEGQVEYASICKALGYSKEFYIRTRHLHSDDPLDHDYNAGDDSDDAASTSRSSSYQTARQSMSSAPSRWRSTPSDWMRSGPSTNASCLSDTSPPSRRYLDDSPDDAAGSGPPTGQASLSERTKRTMPDRSAKPLGDRDVVRRGEPPYVDPSTGELLVSSSLGASAPGTGSTKRPLPDSPKSTLQPDDNARRRREAGDTPSREEMGSSSRSRKKDSHKQRSRA